MYVFGRPNHSLEARTVVDGLRRCVLFTRFRFEGRDINFRHWFIDSGHISTFRDIIIEGSQVCCTDYKVQMILVAGVVVQGCRATLGAWPKHCAWTCFLKVGAFQAGAQCPETTCTCACIIKWERLLIIYLVGWEVVQELSDCVMEVFLELEAGPFHTIIKALRAFKAEIFLQAFQ